MKDQEKIIQLCLLHLANCRFFRKNNCVESSKRKTKSRKYKAAQMISKTPSYSQLMSFGKSRRAKKISVPMFIRISQNTLFLRNTSNF